MDEQVFSEAAGIPLDHAAVIWPYMLDAFNEFEITKQRRIAAFIAQTAHESAGYTALREDTYYTKPEALLSNFSRHFGPDKADPSEYLRSSKKLANFVYANEGGNGDVDSGDGWRFRAGGYLGITFHDGYAWMAELLDLPLVDEPELIETHEVAARTAGAYWANTQWKGENLNILADQWDIQAISGLISRGHPRKAAAGAADRLRRSEKALKVIKRAMT